MHTLNCQSSLELRVSQLSRQLLSLRLSRHVMTLIPTRWLYKLRDKASIRSGLGADITLSVLLSLRQSRPSGAVRDAQSISQDSTLPSGQSLSSVLSSLTQSPVVFTLPTLLKLTSMSLRTLTVKCQCQRTKSKLRSMIKSYTNYLRSKLLSSGMTLSQLTKTLDTICGRTSSRWELPRQRTPRPSS